MKRATMIVPRLLPEWSSVMASLALLIWGAGVTVDAQSTQDAGMIREIKPSPSVLNVGKGFYERVGLSITVIGPDGNEDQSLASTTDIIWSAPDGELEVHYDTTRATYTLPQILGTHTVTASVESGCIGEPTDCTATFTIRVMRADPPPSCIWWNHPATPTALIDAEGTEYEVFTPRDGGRIDGIDFRVVAECGDVPMGEFIGVRMFQNGAASDDGMSHHAYALSGNQYKISIVDAEVRLIASYALYRDVEVCIPVPDELRSKLSGIVMVTKNDDRILTLMSSSVRISPSLIICGWTRTLPVTVAAGIPGTRPPLFEPEHEPPEKLPVTGGAAPPSTTAVIGALIFGIALIGAGGFMTAYRRRRY